MSGELEVIRKLLRAVKLLKPCTNTATTTTAAANGGGGDQHNAKYLMELERSLHSLEDRISAMKLRNRQKILELTQKERRLESELNDFEQRIMEWDRLRSAELACTSPSATLASHRLSERIKSLSMDRRIEEYDAFMAKRGGRTGGWSDQDHTIFTKLRAKYRVSTIID